jgi:hypothetical protein
MEVRKEKNKVRNRNTNVRRGGTMFVLTKQQYAKGSWIFAMTKTQYAKPTQNCYNDKIEVRNGKIKVRIAENGVKTRVFGAGGRV